MAEPLLLVKVGVSDDLRLMKGTAMFEIWRANGGGYYWTLKASNGEKLCHSEVYTTKQSAHNGIAAVKRIAPIAPVYER